MSLVPPEKQAPNPFSQERKLYQAGKKERGKGHDRRANEFTDVHANISL